MDFDAIVIGGGHAGIEAALALSRMDNKVLMITQNLDTIGKMSCNPAVGGLAKGNMVREIDALGGQMGRLIDATMIQFRILNQRKGPAVQSPRAQADKVKYQLLAKEVCENEKNLTLFMDTVVDFEVKTDPSGRERIQGVVTERGRKFSAKVVVLTTGTFLNGRVFIGEYRADSGRLGEPAARGLDLGLKRLGFEIGRMKTGTPARIHKDSMDLSRLEVQFGDQDIVPFSFSHLTIDRPNLPCYITYTHQGTHEIIRQNMHRSPLYSGEIKGIGPRYCPSLEDKVVKFPHRERHQIFIEPEGADTKEMYLNGMSSSLPEDVQEAFIRSLPGLEEAVIMRPGYAVEYDYLDPLQLYPSLETKLVAGLFVAGQTNGTSGYEEAAAQGLMAGINAGRMLRGEPALILNRAEAYIGVMIDDLVTLGSKEPYRMFTSRAEHRISLRHDSADIRLFERAWKMGLQTDEAWQEFQNKQQSIADVKELLAKRHLNTADLAVATPGLDLAEVYKDGPLGRSFLHLLRSPQVSLEHLALIEPAIAQGRSPDWLRQVELDIKYEGYVARQEQQILRFSRMEDMKIPPDFNYDGIKSLTNEAREKFRKIRPLSIGQAGRIPGVRNGDLAILMVHVARRPRQTAADAELSEAFLQASKVPLDDAEEAEAFIAANRLASPSIDEVEE